MRYRRTHRATLIRKDSPLTVKDMIKREAQLDDESMHRNTPIPGLPKNSLKDKFEITITSAYAMAWDASEQVRKSFPSILQILKLAIP